MEKKTDRYVTFKGIDGEGNSRRLLELLAPYIDDPATSNPFWEKFKAGLNQTTAVSSGGNRRDELLLVHSYINNMRELFEAHDDREALDLLQQVELESC
jgi:hypothetical protein